MNKKEEIFTIGDKTTLGIITCFRLLDNEIMVDFDNKNSILLRSKKLQKVKKPLFTTEDGVDIFEGDKYFICTASLSKCINKEGIVNKFFKLNPNYKYFSTKEKVEEYILMNKPCLSLNDVILEANRINKNKGFIKAKLGQSLKELVNTKING